LSLRKTRPPLDHELLDHALDALEGGDPEQALELVDAVLRAKPDMPAALFVQGEAFRDLRLFAEAQRAFRDALTGDRELTAAWIGLATVSNDLFDPEEAAAAASRALRAEPWNPEALFQRAISRTTRGDTAGAMRDHTRAWRADPNYTVPPELDDQDLVRLLAIGAGHMHPAVGAYLEHVSIMVQGAPGPETCDTYEPAASPIELLGHFAVTRLDHEANLDPWGRLPAALVLYRHAMCRAAGSTELLLLDLCSGVLSQVAQYLGIQEDERLDLGILEE